MAWIDFETEEMAKEASDSYNGKIEINDQSIDFVISVQMLLSQKRIPKKGFRIKKHTPTYGRHHRVQKK